MAYEFPHTMYENTDLQEVLNIVSNLKSEYDGLLKRMSNMESTLNGLQSGIQSMVDKATKSEVTKQTKSLSQRIDELEQLFGANSLGLAEQIKTLSDKTLAALNKLDAKYGNKTDDIVSTNCQQFSRIDEKICECFTEIDSSYDQATDYTDEQMLILRENMDTIVNELSSKYDNLYENLYDLIKDSMGVIQNPMTGQLEPVGAAIRMLYYALISNHVLTVGQYDSKAVAAEEIDRCLHSVEKVSVNTDVYYPADINNPITGSKQDMTGIISAIAKTGQSMTNHEIEMAGISYAVTDTMTYGEWERNKEYFTASTDVPTTDTPVSK